VPGLDRAVSDENGEVRQDDQGVGASSDPELLWGTGSATSQSENQTDGEQLSREQPEGANQGISLYGTGSEGKPG
jgi:hypothetical protein